MNAHRVKVFNGTNDDAVVVFITHHLHLIFFPAQQRLVDQQLIGRRQIQTASTDFDKVVLVISDATTRATHGKGGPDDTGIAESHLDLFGLFQRVGEGRYWGRQANGFHCHIKFLTVFSHVDRIATRADHFHIKALKDAFAGKIQRTVQCRLAAHGRQ